MSIHRLGDKVVNFYLIEHPDGLVLIDSGLPRHLTQLTTLLATLPSSPQPTPPSTPGPAHPSAPGLSSTPGSAQPSAPGLPFTAGAAQPFKPGSSSTPGAAQPSTPGSSSTAGAGSRSAAGPERPPTTGSEMLSAAGFGLGDIRAVLLTHGHPDHTGLAGPLSRAGAEIWVHEQDAPILRDGPRSAMRHAKPQRSMLPYLLRRPAAIGTPLHLALTGAFTAAPVPEVQTISGDTTLDGVPGRPQAIALPGHTGGSLGYLFPDLGVIFTGDALVTHDGLTGHTGPAVVCRAFTQDGDTALASLDRLAGLPADQILPGHGEPFTAGPRAAAAQARAYGLH